LRVSEDWVVETVDIELAAHHAVIELVSKSESETGIFNAETRRKNWVMCRKFVRWFSMTPIAEVPTQTACLNLAGSYPVRKDCARPAKKWAKAVPLSSE